GHDECAVMTGVVVAGLDAQINGPFLRLINDADRRCFGVAEELFLNLHAPEHVCRQPCFFQRLLDQFFASLATNVAEIEEMTTRAFYEHRHGETLLYLSGE